MQIREKIAGLDMIEEKKQSFISNTELKINSEKSSIFYNNISILEVWRLFIDGILQKQELGWLGFEEREKNYLASMCRCLAFAFNNIEQELNVNFILKLHEIAMGDVSNTLYEHKATKTKPGQIRSEPIVYTLSTLFVSREGFSELVKTMTKQPHLALKSYFDTKTYNEFIQIKQKTKRIDFLYKCIEEGKKLTICGFANKENREALILKKFELFIKKYKSDIIACNNILDTLKIILTFARNCERMHVFSDGNGRIFYMTLLYFLFAQNKLPLPFMTNMNTIAGYSMDELITEVEKGWEHNIQLKTTNFLFNLSTFEILSMMSRQEQTYFIYSLEPLEPYFRSSSAFDSIKNSVAELLSEYKLKIRKTTFQNKIFTTTLNSPLIRNDELSPLLSIKRKLEHIKRFGAPQNFLTVSTPLLLLSKKYLPIYHMILEIAGDFKGPHIIPPIVDHWTKLKNIKTIVSCNALYGHVSLKKHGIQFIPNALHGFDKKNLDGNVICFSPGGFVDPLALMNENDPHSDLVRLRVDLTKLKTTGSFNTFFKAVDLGMSHFKVNINLTKNLKMTIEKNLISSPTSIENPEHSEYSFTFELQGKSPLKVFLEDNDLIYYGDLAGINRFCLLLPFVALNFSNKFQLVESIYQELNGLNPRLLKKILITMAQNITTFSEYNFNGFLRLAPQSIYDIHVVSTNMTYQFHDLSKEDYNNALQSFFTEKNLDNIPNQKEKIFSYAEESEITLYNQKVNYKTIEPTCFAIDATCIDDTLFETGYTETRSKRNVSTIKKSYGFLFFSSTKQKEKIMSQSLEHDCSLPMNVRDIICSYHPGK